MTEKKPGERASADSGKTPAGPEKPKSKNKEWFHDSSLTESEALRAMIGKQRKKEDKHVEEPKKEDSRNSNNESENHNKRR